MLRGAARRPLHTALCLLMAGTAWAPARAEEALALVDVPAVDIADLHPTAPVLTAQPDQAPPPATLAQADPAPAAPDYGPPAPETGVHTKRELRSFGQQLGAVKWEYGGVVAYMTVINVAKLHKVGARSFHFQNEGWFGKSTINLGVDKMAHAFNTYAIADILYARIRRKTDSPGAAVTAAVLASSLQLYSELYDGIKKSSGWSWEDVAFNTGGAAFSALRNSIPGMRDKLDFRLLFIPNSDIYTFMGGKHYEQERFLLALQLGGFDAFKHTPLRFVELQAGYYAKDFSGPDRDAGKIPQRKPFIGVGLNLQELLFPHPRSRAAKIGRGALDYFQLPYTAVHVSGSY